ncbi:MAG: sulfatase-like hydrolase/transferase [Sedimentisphaerales bacterium]|nr:sulfatase-like hydrolase/transferase [Sedimentisphaerales bacterium]
MNRRAFIKRSIGTTLAYGLGLTSARRSRAAGKTATRPNILWIMLDDGRADALSCYGKPWARTPHLDAVAARGVRFETAIVQNPVCVPSRKSMKSGHYPHAFGLTAMGKPAAVQPTYMKEARDVPNLLDAWAEIDMAPINIGKTHAYRQDWAKQQDVGPAFDVLGRPRTEVAKKRLEQTGTTYPAAVTKTHGWAIGGTVPFEPEEMSTWKLGDLAVDTLKGLTAKDEPFFLRVSFHAPHVPCRVPKEYMVDPAQIELPQPTAEELATKPRFERGPLHVYAGAPHLTQEQIDIARGTYYGMLWLVDAQVGRLVEHLRKSGQLDNTIIAFNSDQGFQLGEHGLWKKRVFYEQNVKVPLILSCPALLPKGKVIAEPVEMIDFVPTLMDLCGLQVPANISGRSLMPLIRGQISEWREACFCEIDHSMSMYEELRQRSGRRVMVRTKEWKMIWFMDERTEDKDGALYNLKEDPGETENLYDRPEYTPVIQYLERLCREWSRPPVAAV